ncbi:MAG: ABC transporter substrate-binding protein [Nitrospira sp.]|nr:ABC transporter substrate-binding protein [Nitrospira sp.]
MMADLDSLRPSVRGPVPGWNLTGRSLWLAACLGVLIVAVTLRLVASAQIPPVHVKEGSVPSRILSVNVMSDEILLALVPERLIGLSVVADSESSNIVEEAKVIPTRVDADSERILMLNPDLVLIGSHHANVARQIESLGIPLFQIQGFESIEWIRSLLRTMGTSTGVPERAERLIAEMNARIENVSRRVAGLPRPRVLLYSESGWVSGAKTTIDDAIRAAGGVNVAAELGIVGGGKVPQERVIMADPDVILLRYSRIWESGFRQALLGDPAFRDVKALRNQRVYSIPARLLVTSSHHIAKTVETIARHLHPDVFPEASP